MIESLITHQALISWCITNRHLLGDIDKIMVNQKGLAQ